MKRFLLLLLLLCLLLAAGCGNRSSSRSEPFSLEEGSQPFSLGSFRITQEGIAGLAGLLRDYAPLPQTLALRQLDAEIESNGLLTSFTMLVEGYDGQKQPAGVYRFAYEDGQMTYTPPAQNAQNGGEESAPYNANNDLSYLDREFKRIPWKQQLALLDFPRYEIHYGGSRQTTQGEPLIDGSGGKSFPALTLEEYREGQGGTGDGKTAVLFMLGDGSSWAVGENLLIYRCEAADRDSLVQSRQPGDRMACRVNNGQLELSRDYGESWISCSLPENELNDTLAFYNKSNLPSGTYYISEKKPGIAAVLYGAAPKLYLSRDDGATWETVEFMQPFEMMEDLGYSIRTIRFINESEGYIGIGTDWSMGVGGYRGWFSTQDGGKTWQSHGPLPGSDSQTLTGIVFSDLQHGVISIRSLSDELPGFFATQDGGNTWIELDLPWGDEIGELHMYSRVKSLEYQNGNYTLTVMQQDSQARRAVFESSSLTGGWTRRAQDQTVS